MRKFVVCVLAFVLLLTAFGFKGSTNKVMADVQEETCSIAGYIKPEWNCGNYYKPSTDNKDIKVEVLGTEVFSYTNEYGYFKISGLAKNAAEYRIKVSKPSYLSRYIEIVGLYDKININYPGSALEIWAGDVKTQGSQDEVINMEDIISAAKSFNSVLGEENYISEYDFNLDKVINIEDIMIISKHFNNSSSDYNETKIIIRPEIIPTPTPTPEVAYGEGKVEAEKMKLSGYLEGEFEGETCVELANNMGIAYYMFEGEPGYYDFNVRYLDEATGQGNLGLYIGGRRIGGAWKLTEDDNAWKVKTIRDVFISPGTKIMVQGGKNSEELSRIDYVETVFNHAPTPAPSPEIITISGKLGWIDIEGGFYKIGEYCIDKGALFGVSQGSMVEVTGYVYCPLEMVGFGLWTTSYKVLAEPDSIPTATPTKGKEDSIK